MEAVKMGAFQWIVIVAAIAAVAVWWFLPKMQMKSWRDISNVKDRAEAEDNFRRTVTQLLGGIGLVAGLFLTLEEINTSREATDASVKAIREQIESTREQAEQRLASDRFTKGIAQLESTNIFVRVSAVQMLEEVAVQFDGYAQPVVDILEALVRIESQNKPHYDDCVGNENIASLPYDIQAAVSAIFSKRIDQDRQVHLPEAYLPGANLTGANLRGAYLNGADLCMARLQGADGVRSILIGANLAKANLSNADFTRANFEKAVLAHAKLQHVKLDGAYMRDADLSSAVLPDTTLLNADLQGVKVFGADLTMVVGGLSAEQLSTMLCDEETRFPPGRSLSDCRR